mgnify:CR=1 FL=1
MDPMNRRMSPGYRFWVPALPKKWYEWIKTRRVNLHATDRQILLAALTIAAKLPTAEFHEVLKEMQAKHPNDWGEA